MTYVFCVSGFALGAYPQVQAFIKSDSRPARYPGLTIKYVRGADPIIKLLDEDESVAETLAIVSHQKNGCTYNRLYFCAHFF